MLIASKGDNSIKLSIIGAITGESEWYESDAAVLNLVLAQAEGAPLDLWVSSPGGSLDAAFAMRAMLAEYSGDITIHTAGMVASAATLLLCIPNARVVAQRGSTFMLHNARMGWDGNAEEMRKCADILDVCDDEIAAVYKLRLKCGDDELRDMLKAETWLGPDAAKELGLIDDIAAEGVQGYLAEPRNPEPQPDIPAALDNAVSARLEPRIEAIQSGLASIQARGESRAQAISDATTAAVSGIAGASDGAVKSMREIADGIRESLTAELKAIRDEMAECRRSYDKQADKYMALDEAISRAYALAGGDLGSTVHDEQVKRARGFKLDI